jgi:molybdopterin synthase sulfur carrier subunit
VPQVRVARAFRLHVDCPDLTVPGTCVRDALLAYFAEHPAVRSYVLDEHGAVRQHVVVFVDDEQITDKAGQSDAVGEGSVISVFQALSGG